MPHPLLPPPATTPTEHTTLIVVVVIIIISIIFFTGYTFYQYRNKRKQSILDQIAIKTAEMDQIERLISSFKLQLKLLIKLPGAKSIIASKGLFLIPYILLGCVIAACVLLNSALASDHASFIQGQRSETVFTSYVLFFIGVNGFYLSRVTSSSSSGGDKSLNNSKNNNNLHITPQYRFWNKNWQNILQLFILFVEFIQLCAFPINDLLKTPAIEQLSYFYPNSPTAKFKSAMESILSFFISGFPKLDTVFLSSLQFALAWWGTVIGVGLGLVFIYLPKISISTKSTVMIYTLPIVNLLYLPTMQSFLSVLSCQINWITGFESSPWARIRKCQNVVLYEPRSYAAYALTGYVLAYLFMTIFRTSNSPKPKPGVISFTSRSEVFNKNGTLSFLLVYYLFVVRLDNHNQTALDPLVTVRGVLACLISFVLVVYNVLVGSSYVQSINYVRTLSYCCVFWLSIIVTFYTDPKNQSILLTSNTATSQILVAILVGWVAVFVIFSMFWWVYWEKFLSKKVVVLEREDTVPPPPVPPKIDTTSHTKIHVLASPSAHSMRLRSTPK